MKYGVDQLRAMSTGVGLVLVVLDFPFRYRVDTEQYIVATLIGVSELRCKVIVKVFRSINTMKPNIFRIGKKYKKPASFRRKFVSHINDTLHVI